MLAEKITVNDDSHQFDAEKSTLINNIKNRRVGLSYLPDRFYDDYDVMMTAVQLNGYSMEYASTRLRSNREFVETAVQYDVNVLRYWNVLFRYIFTFFI